MLGIASPPRQVPAGEVGQEPGGLVGPFGQVGHPPGGPARLVVEPCLNCCVDGRVEQLDGQARITIRGQVSRLLQILLCGRHLASQQAEATPDRKQPHPGRLLPGGGYRLGQPPGPLKVTALERGFCGRCQPDGPRFCFRG